MFIGGIKDPLGNQGVQIKTRSVYVHLRDITAFHYVFSTAVVSHFLTRRNFLPLYTV